MPAGLSMTRRPSRASDSLMLRLELIQQLLDPHFLFEGFVVVEGQLRNPSQMVQPLTQRAPGVTRRGSKTLEDFLAVLYATKRADEHPGMPKVWGYFDMSHG